jgi:DNA polymerase-3 subunit delta'
MSTFPNFYGNAPVVDTLAQMIEGRRIAQTIILSGPEGVGKATLVRRFASTLLGGKNKIEGDDLSLAQNLDVIEEREKWTADKRNDDPLLFSTHPDFVTFPPEGPLRQITIQQMRLLRERAQFKPLKGEHRVFLIDHLDRANEQAANSLLKVLEEPPEHLIILATAENLYDVLPTIRSRSVTLPMKLIGPRTARCCLGRLPRNRGTPGSGAFPGTPRPCVGGIRVFSRRDPIFRMGPAIRSALREEIGETRPLHRPLVSSAR